MINAQDTRHKMQDTRYKVQDSNKLQIPKNKFQRPSIWMLNIGYWLLFGFCILSLVAYFSILPVRADSVWNDNSASPYNAQKAYRVGDIVNVIIMENTSAKNKARTKTNVRDDLGLQFAHTIQRLAPIIGASNQVTGQVSNKFTGDGETTRSNDVSARVAAWVTNVFPNGNLEIRGRHKVEVNDEMQEITVSGIVRPKDLSGENTVYSYQVANAEVSVRGTGVIADTESPGWITRLFNWIF
ncbi:MAG: flagellar basal body L-ring protein FlgH [Candidatus Saganbacteria bacterium]|nr:flagellar basal body L-ring protein FlgH [Candidatus Saganbacteria bacterium]